MDNLLLPCNMDAERMVLGALLLNHQLHVGVFQQLKPEDFSIEKHRRIYTAMRTIDESGGKVDRVTLASYLHDRRQLESVDGLTYLTCLDDGMPQNAHIESYMEIVREKSSLRKIIVAAQHLINRCVTADPGSAADLIALADQTLMQIGYGQSETAQMMTPGEVVEHAGGIDKFLNPDPGARSPWHEFDIKTGGYRRGELFVLAGNPSMGKSAAALQVAMRIAEDGLGALICSLEMSRSSLVKRMACYRSRVDGGKLQNGYLNNEERTRLRKAIHEMSNWPLWIVEHGISTVSAIRAAIRKRRAKREIFMVVIDYLQLLTTIGRSGQNRNTEVSEITRALKLMAVDENVNIQLLSQLNRDNMKERRPPELRDLRESGSIEQDADAVAFVWRPEMLFRDREDLRGQAELILAKQRNGPTGKIPLTWLGHITAFESRAEDYREQEVQ